MQVLHPHTRAFPDTGAGRSTRGITLIATVLLSVLAATIALVIVRQTSLVVDADASQLGDLVVDKNAENIKREFEAKLSTDPQFYLHETFKYERPRGCRTSDAALTYVLSENAAGQPTSVTWPAECGVSWTYAPAVEPGATITIGDGEWDPQHTKDRVEITPPGPQNPFLTLTVLTAGGNQESGLRTTYTLNTASRWTLYSQQDLNVADMPGIAGFTGTGARAYSANNITVPGQAQDFTAAALLAEGEVFINGNTSADVFNSSNIRQAVPTPLSLSQLAGSTAYAYTAACGTDPAQTPKLSVLRDQNSYASTVCVQNGQTLISTSGDLVPVPSDATAYLVRANQATASSQIGDGSTLDIYYSDQDLTFPATCETTCDIATISANLRGSGNYPADGPGQLGSPWKKLATTNLPVSAVAFFDKDTYIGEQSLTSQLNENLTVLAGTAANPANIYLSGNLEATSEALVGLVATGGVYVPYYATSSGNNLTIDASIVALRASEHDAAFSTLPAGGIPAQAARGTVTIRGSLAAASIGQTTAAAQTAMTVNEQLTIANPPAFPAFTNTWSPVQTLPLTSADVCGDQIAGTDYATCLRSW